MVLRMAKAVYGGHLGQWDAMEEGSDLAYGYTSISYNSTELDANGNSNRSDEP